MGAALYGVAEGHCIDWRTSAATPDRSGSSALSERAEACASVSFRPIADITAQWHHRSMRSRIHNAARLGTITLTVVGAVFGSFAGLVASEWGGVFIIVPVLTGIFALLGALLGGAAEFLIRM